MLGCCTPEQVIMRAKEHRVNRSQIKEMLNKNKRLQKVKLANKNLHIYVTTYLCKIHRNYTNIY